MTVHWFDPAGGLRAEFVRIREEVSGRLAKLLALVASAMNTLDRTSSIFSAGNLYEQIESAIARLDAVVQETEDSLNKLSDRAERGFWVVRQFCVITPISRPVKDFFCIKTIFVALLLILAEGTMGAGMLVADGSMDITLAAAYGLIVAGVNIMLSILAGYWGGRYFNFRLGSLRPKPWHRSTRFLARIGVVQYFIALLTLHFAAARTRILGEHHGIFNFETVSFFATFDDTIALIIIFIGFAGAFIAFMEGYYGLNDPCPGYADIVEKAGDEIDNMAYEQREDSLDAIEDIYENILDLVEKRRSEQKIACSNFEAAQNNYNDSVDKLHQAIENAKVEYRRRCDHAQNIVAQIVGRSFKPIEIGDLNLDKYQVSHSDSVFRSDLNEDRLGQLLSEITCKRDFAIAAVKQAHGRYVAQRPDLFGFPHVNPGD